MARHGLNPRFNASPVVLTFEDFAQQGHIDRLPTFKNGRHVQRWINTLRDYAFPKVGRMPVDTIGQREILMCLSLIWTEEHETARRLAQRIKTVLDVARARGFRDGEKPVTAIRDGHGLPKVVHHGAMPWRDVRAFFARLQNALAAKALRVTCLTGARTGEVLGMR